MSAPEARVDVVVIGGGVAGLWLMRRLGDAGYSALLIEAGALGYGQTIAAQGIIHGGTKYALTDRLTGASKEIAEMPAIWRRCLDGEGPLDLSRTSVLSHCQFLWSPGAVASNLAAFFAAKALRGRVRSVTGDERPEVFRTSAFRGTVYALDEIVVDVPSLLSDLSGPLKGAIIRVPPRDVTFDFDEGGAVKAVRLTKDRRNEQTTDEEEIRIGVGAVLAAAGTGNEGFLTSLRLEGRRAQRRPLHMVMARGAIPFDLYGHCLGAGPTPRLTVTTHRPGRPSPADGDDERIWYLGGALAESGVDRSPEEQVRVAHRELVSLFPWIDFSRSQWATLRIDRAEPSQSGDRRPEAPLIAQEGNRFVIWPTKLAFAPRLADEALKRIAALLRPGPYDLAALADRPAPAIARPPWETAEWITVD